MCVNLGHLFAIAIIHQVSAAGREDDAIQFSGKVPTYPSPNLTLTLILSLGKMLGLGRGRWSVSQKRPLIQNQYSVDSAFSLGSVIHPLY